jgi:dolichol-phosphate mannosyltransferase
MALALVTRVSYRVAMEGRAGKTLVCIPTYEERDNVGPMLDELERWAPDCDKLFIDDNSPDGTGELLDERAKTNARLTVIHRKGKLGIGGAHLDGIAYAYDHGYDTLVTLDCDFTHSPSDIPRLVEVSADADITIGSRFLERDSLPGWNIARKVLTNVGHLLTASVLGIQHDATGAFRVYRLSGIRREMFELIKARGYAFFFESLCVAHQNKLTIREVPIKLPARTQGHSKMSFREIQKSVGQLVKLFVATRTSPSQFRVANGARRARAPRTEPAPVPTTATRHP